MNKELPLRIGHAYDFHCLIKNRKLILGGVHIPYSHGLLGHSDADCLTHALADSILGAMGLPDIGNYFPDNDIRYKGLDSKIILKKAIDEIKKQNYRVGNVDLTIVAEKPKLSYFVEKIKISLSKTMELDPNFIGIKATTNEGAGPVGRSEGIAVYSVCTIVQS